MGGSISTETGRRVDSSDLGQGKSSATDTDNIGNSSDRLYVSAGVVDYLPPVGKISNRKFNELKQLIQREPTPSYMKLVEGNQTLQVTSSDDKQYSIRYQQDIKGFAIYKSKSSAPRDLGGMIAKAHNAEDALAHVRTQMPEDIVLDFKEQVLKNGLPTGLEMDSSGFIKGDFAGGEFMAAFNRKTGKYHVRSGDLPIRKYDSVDEMIEYNFTHRGEFRTEVCNQFKTTTAPHARHRKQGFAAIDSTQHPEVPEGSLIRLDVRGTVAKLWVPTGKGGYSRFNIMDLPDYSSGEPSGHKYQMSLSRSLSGSVTIISTDSKQDFMGQLSTKLGKLQQIAERSKS